MSPDVTVNVHAAERGRKTVNGPVLAAFLAAGIGTLALGVFVLLNEAGFFAAPAVYPPAGGVSGRTTFATIVWLLAWGVLHRLWKDRQIDSPRPSVATLVLVGFGVIATFPLVWRLF